MTHNIPSRKDAPREQTWDMESVFPTPAAWEQGVKELEALLPDLAAFKGRLSDGPRQLLTFIEKMESTGQLIGKLFVYASAGYAVDTTDQAAAARSGQARGVFAKFSAAIAFFDPELISIGFETLKKWVAENPELAFFAHYVDNLEKQQEHVQSEAVEQVLALVSDPLSTPMSVYNVLSSADMVFKPAVDSQGNEVEVGQSSIGGLLTHADREVRRTAWENYNDAFLGMKNTFAANLVGGFKRDVFYAQARGYKNSLEGALKPAHIPVDVFHNLIEVFKKNLPTWHRYWQIRKRALGYEKLHEYDIKAPLTASKPEVPFAQAVDWISEGMAPLGESYVHILRKGCLEDRWVDYVINKGKREGAFSTGSQGTHPFIMMSYNDDLFSLSTLAHELGHSLHSYHSRKHQRFMYSRYGLFVAEVASNFNQAMVRQYLFNTRKDPSFQIALIEEAMSNFHRYFFIMPTLARFELEMHERLEKGQPVNADLLIQRMAELFKEGYGDEVDFDQPRIGITWAQFVHMFMNFYVYQYATGISGAYALADQILAGEAGAAQRYIDFLKSGGSVYPLDALKAAGVDLTSPEPVEKAFAVLADMVDRLDKLV